MTYPPAPKLSLAGAVDLSGLGQPSVPELTEVPDGAFQCDVPDGCNMVVLGEIPHSSLNDCLDTTVPYVARYLETREAALEISEAYHNAVAGYRAVLEANNRLVDEKERLTAELREARRGTPLAAKGVLEGAGDLAASMKANFGSESK